MEKLRRVGFIENVQQSLCTMQMQIFDFLSAGLKTRATSRADLNCNLKPLRQLFQGRGRLAPPFILYLTQMGILATLAVVAALSGTVLATGLVDSPIAGDGNIIQYLDGEGWTVTNGADINIGARVPGDLITDLQLAGVIGDPLYELNFQATTWDDTNFNYSTTFTVDASITSRLTASPSTDVLLVFDSLKMAGDVWLDDTYL